MDIKCDGPLVTGTESDRASGKNDDQSKNPSAASVSVEQTEISTEELNATVDRFPFEWQEQQRSIPKGIDDAIVEGVEIIIRSGDEAQQLIQDMNVSAKSANPTETEKKLKEACEVVDAFIKRNEGKEFPQDMGDREFDALALIKRSDINIWTRKKYEIRRLNLGINDVNRHLKGPEEALRREEAARHTGGEYDIHGGGLYWHKPTQQGKVHVPLTNFTAKIESETQRDDGAEVVRLFSISGKRNDGVSFDAIELPSEEFTAMGWPTKRWGARAIVFAGSTIRENARVAIQKISGVVSSTIEYGHTGWRMIDGEPHYLHTGGAISKQGNRGEVLVNLGETRLKSFMLNVPMSTEEARLAVLASLELATLGSFEVGLVALAAIYRAPLSEILPAVFTNWWSGLTGVFKSELASLQQAHFGAGYNSRNLPGSWESTINSLEKQAFVLKDALFVIDDFAPRGAAQDVMRLHRDADRLIRSQGNHSGRGRMKADGGFRPTYFPRGILVVTGEDILKGHSARARCWISEVVPGSIHPDRLTSLQKKASRGLFATSMGGYVRWIASRWTHLLKTLPELKSQLMQRARDLGVHKRTPEVVADLMLGWQIFITYAEDCCAISPIKGKELIEEAWAALEKSSAEQGRFQISEDPAIRFMELLVSAISSGDAHFAKAEDGSHPDNPSQWGWRQTPVFEPGGFAKKVWRPCGTKVGWIAKNEVWLQKDAALGVVQSMARKQNDSLAITPTTLWKRFDDKKWITRGEPSKFSAKRTVEGNPGQYVIVVSDKSIIFSQIEESERPGQNSVLPESLLTNPNSLPPVASQSAERRENA